MQKQRRKVDRSHPKPLVIEYETRLVITKNHNLTSNENYIRKNAISLPRVKWLERNFNEVGK